MKPKTDPMTGFRGWIGTPGKGGAGFFGLYWGEAILGAMSGGLREKGRHFAVMG